MQPLSYISAYTQRGKSASSNMRTVSVNLITNFTDDVLERVFGGLCLSEHIYSHILRAPYKQYAFAFKERSSALNRSKPDISFIFFDGSQYAQSEFLNSTYRNEVLQDIDAYAQRVKGTVVVNLCIIPHNGPYGHFFREEPLFRALTEFNNGLQELALRNSAVHCFDTNRVMSEIGELHGRDPRGHYAFDMPFTTEFLTLLASHWLSYVRAILGLSRKCIVLDLDNTLWGGVLGEEGPLGIILGPEYPGLAYQNFQRSLLSFWNRGIILAISSKNNEADVDEVFERNPHMVLKRDHFASLRANWDDKSKNIQSLAEELNIGTDSMVFIDDSPLERERMRVEAPEVLTPEWTMEPEQYTRALFSLNVFHQMSLTEEDKKKGEMYAQENKRKKVLYTTLDINEYISKLHIQIQVKEGLAIDIARASQLTQKTNQCNLTTRRYTESDLRRMMEKGDRIITGEVSDTFGGYGVVILAILSFSKGRAVLDSFLMSCRVMGRGVEQAFLTYIIRSLHKEGVKKLSAQFIPTAKNKPAATMLPDVGFTHLKNGSYEITIPSAIRKLTALQRKRRIAVRG